ARQRARKLANHERRRQAPKNRQKQQNRNSATVTRAVNNLLGPVGAARHHEKRRRDQRPERQLRGSLFWCGKYLGRNLGGNRYATQFLRSPSLGNICSRRGGESKLAFEEYKVCTGAQQKNGLCDRFLARPFHASQSTRELSLVLDSPR